jgi:hypothetical protein
MKNFWSQRIFKVSIQEEADASLGCRRFKILLALALIRILAADSCSRKVLLHASAASHWFKLASKSFCLNNSLAIPKA